MTRVLDVSVVVPTYNRRALVASAVRSLLDQSLPVREILVVDDGSTDGTAEAIEREFGSAVTLLRQPNRGVSAARNAGLSRAVGRYLSFLDSDEVWLPRKAELQSNWLDAHPDFGMVLCNLHWRDKSGRELGVFDRRSQIPRDGRVLEDVLLMPSLAPSSAMLRREVYEEVGGFDESLRTAEDIDLHIRIARRWPVGVVDEALVSLVRGEGLSKDPSSCDDYVRAMERAIARLAGEVDDGIARRALARCYLRNARSMLFDDRWGPAWELARKGWACAPDIRERLALTALAPAWLRRVAIRVLRRHGSRSIPDRAG